MVGIYNGGTLLSKINLYASSTRYQTLILLPRFSTRSVTLTLKVLST